MVFKKFNNKKNSNKPDDNFQSEVRLKLPKTEELEQFGLVTIMTGTEYIKVLCEDEVERAARIPGKMRNKVWIKENDVVILRVWEEEKHKADVVWRFLPFQVAKLKEKGLLTKLPI